MSSIMHNAVYNSRIEGMLTPSSSRLGRLLLILSMLLLATTALAQDWAVGEQQLAAKILAVTSARAINVEVSNRSSLSTASADDVRRGLLTQLAAWGALRQCRAGCGKRASFTFGGSAELCMGSGCSRGHE